MTKIPLVLVPGLLCDHALWAAQIEHLGDVAEVTVADVTGAESGADSIAAFAEDVLAAAPPKFALAGLSMGGYVSFEIMRRVPERVLKLALVDTHAIPDFPEVVERRRALIDMAQHGRFKGATKRLLKEFLHPDRLLDTALCEAVMAMTERVGREAFFRQQRAIMARPDSRPDLTNFACPSLVLCGRQDTLTTLERHREMADLIPGAKLAVIENCGHLAPMERPEATTALMRLWLDYAL